MKTLVGLTGIAGSGKNLFAKLFTEKYGKKYKIIEHSLAFQLRKELAPIIKKNFGLDVWAQKPEEKKLLRGFLTHWADMRRRQTEGAYWWHHLDLYLSKQKYEIALITDVRFKEYEYDELEYFKGNGYLVHLSKYEIIKGRKVFLKPPNEFEKRNDPLMKKGADIRIQWPDARKMPYEVDLMAYVEKVGKKLNLE